MRWRLEDVALEFMMETWRFLGNFELLWMSFLAEGRWNDATKFWNLGKLRLWSAGALFMCSVCCLRLLHVLFYLIYVIWFCWSVAFVRGITVNLKKKNQKVWTFSFQMPCRTHFFEFWSQRSISIHNERLEMTFWHQRIRNFHAY